MEKQNIKILTTSRGPVEYLDTGNGELHSVGGKKLSHCVFKIIR